LFGFKLEERDDFKTRKNGVIQQNNGQY